MEQKFTPIKRAHLPVNFVFGGIEQDLFTPDPKKVWTLPHLASSGGTVPLREGMQVGPIAPIGRTIEQYRAADVREARTQAQIPNVAIFPGTGIAKSGDLQAWGRAVEHGFIQFFPDPQIGIRRGREALNLTQSFTANGLECNG